MCVRFVRCRVARRLLCLKQSLNVAMTQKRKGVWDVRATATCKLQTQTGVGSNLVCCEGCPNLAGCRWCRWSVSLEEQRPSMAHLSQHVRNAILLKRPWSLLVPPRNPAATCSRPSHRTTLHHAAMAGERDVLSVDAVTPVRYALELTPDLDRFVFAGTAAIELKVTAETTEITVNAKELHVSKASVTCSDGSVLAAQAINQDLVKSRMTFCFASAIPTGDAVLKVVFTGELNNQMAGFYRSSCTTVDGTKKTMASTQFEAIDARRCFPCWDEPNRKAVFGVRSLCAAAGILVPLPRRSAPQCVFPAIRPSQGTCGTHSLTAAVLP